VPVDQDAQVLVHRIRRVGRVPDSYEMAKLHATTLLHDFDDGFDTGNAGECLVARQ
jgi:hypothetical protein